MNQEIATPFDYAALAPDTRSLVEARTGEIRSLTKRAAEDIISIGEALADVKAELEHGQFGAWLKAEFLWSHRSADNMMAVADKFATVANLEMFAPSALYLLSSPSTPAEAVKEAKELALSGEKVTKKKAGEIKDKHSPKKPKADKPAEPEPIVVDASPRTPEQESEMTRQAVGHAAQNGERKPGDDVETELEPLADDEGRYVPDQADAAFRRKGEYLAICRGIDELKRQVDGLAGHPSAAHLHLSTVVTHLDNAKKQMWASKPGYVCPKCKGKTVVKDKGEENRCPLCVDLTRQKAVGWLTKLIWTNNKDLHKAK